MSVAYKIQPDFGAKSDVGWNCKVLIVDDEPAIREIYRELLMPTENVSAVQSSRSQTVVSFPEGKSKFGFHVYEAGDAEQALDLVRSMSAKGEYFAVGFFDVRLGGGMDGVDLVKAIQEIDPSIYSVFATAYNDRTIDSIAATLGPNTADRWDYMMKPFSGSEVIQKARNFVSLWNLNRESDKNAKQLSEINSRIHESERVTSVAAVARGVAHEFGNLLMQIMGKAEVCKNKSPEEMRNALLKIIEASQRANEILDRFNSLSDAKSKTSVKSMLSVASIVQDALDLMSHQFKKTGVQIKVHADTKSMAYVHATSILQVLVNLMINSIYAMKGKGIIEISVVEKSAENTIVLTLRDTGPGIPEELMEKVLEPFFTTKGSEGTGLGLAISREIIEIDHAGSFSLKNHPDGGLIVQMELPKKVKSATGEVL